MYILPYEPILPQLKDFVHTIYKEYYRLFHKVPFNKFFFG